MSVPNPPYSGPPPGPPPGLPTGLPPGPPGAPQPWQQLPARRFSTGAIWAGVFLALPLMLLVGAVGIGGMSAVGWLGDTIGGAMGALGPFGLGLTLQVLPLVLGVVLAALPGTPTRRGLGLGLVIGWGVWSIVAAGACVLLIAAFTRSMG